MSAFHSERITHAGRVFLVELHPEDSPECPWDSEDGHIVGVRSLRRHEKPARGETILCDTQGDTWVYDFGASLMRAARESWGLSPDSREYQRIPLKPGRSKPTRAQVRAAAVRADASHMAEFIRGDWGYCGVCVRLIGPDDEPIGDPYGDALWRVDYGHPCNPEYWRDVACELADGIIARHRKAWRAALKEARTRRYWAMRDVQTVGV